MVREINFIPIDCYQNVYQNGHVYIQLHTWYLIHKYSAGSV